MPEKEYIARGEKRRSIMDTRKGTRKREQSNYCIIVNLIASTYQRI